jgi:four helix bundle protein
MARFHQLTLWHHARGLVHSVSTATTDVPSSGDLISQVRRAAISVAANIAEGAERGSDREFLRFLRIADGSNAEVQALITLANDANILDHTTAHLLHTQSITIGRMIGALCRRLRNPG